MEASASKIQKFYRAKKNPEESKKKEKPEKEKSGYDRE